MAKTRSNIQSLNCDSVKITNDLTVSGTTDLGTVTWTGAQTFSGAVTFSSSTTHNGPATFASTTTISGKLLITSTDIPATFTAAGTAGTILLRPSNSMLYICMSTNAWYSVQLSQTAFN